MNRDQVPEPQEFVKQICFETTAFLPCYYYMHCAGYDVAMTIKMLDEVVSRSTSKSKLVERITNGSIQKITLPTGETSTARKKRTFVERLTNNTVDTELSNGDLVYCLQTIRGLSPTEVLSNSAYLSGLLRTWFNKHYASAQGALADNLRRAICWIDEAIYKDGVNTSIPSPTKLKTVRKRRLRLRSKPDANGEFTEME